FIYLSTDRAPYEVIEAKMQELLRRIARDAAKEAAKPLNANENTVE
ncbi:MAG: hypothetical protein HUK11_10720, partial [Muribaculaceae bacterium]|nr:hypothetical protein [Muribaculaceae bacterium]